MITSYFKQWTGKDPLPKQILFLMDAEDPNVLSIAVSSGRDTGKTLSLSVVILFYAFILKKTVLIIAPDTKKLWNDVVDLIHKNKMDTPQYIKNTELLDWRNGIVTVDGIEIKFVNKKARSFHADLVCIDEGAMLTDKDWNGAWGSREMTGSKKFIAISTPHRESSFVDIVRDPGRYGFKIHTWSKFDLPWYSKADEEADIVFYKGTNTAAYKAEVLGIVPEVMSRYILKDKVRRILVDLPWQSEGGRMIAGLDLSEGGQAPICILIAEILENKAKVAYVEEFPKQTIDQCMPKIEEILTKFQVEKIHIDSRPDPVSKEASSMVSIPNERIDFRGKKRDMLEHIMKMMDLKRLQIWSGWSKLVREMELYTIDHESYDDQIDSLCLALWDSDKMEEKQVIYPIPRKKYRYR